MNYFTYNNEYIKINLDANSILDNDTVEFLVDQIKPFLQVKNTPIIYDYENQRVCFKNQCLFYGDYRADVFLNQLIITFPILRSVDIQLLNTFDNKQTNQIRTEVVDTSYYSNSNTQQPLPVKEDSEFVKAVKDFTYYLFFDDNLSLKWLFNIGTLLILVAEAFFIRSNWNSANEFIKALILISISALFLLSSFISGKVGLKRSSNAQWLLGIFLIPLSLVTVIIVEIISKPNGTNILHSIAIIVVILLMYGIVMATYSKVKLKLVIYDYINIVFTIFLCIMLPFIFYSGTQNLLIVSLSSVIINVFAIVLYKTIKITYAKLLWFASYILLILSICYLYVFIIGDFTITNKDEAIVFFIIVYGAISLITQSLIFKYKHLDIISQINIFIFMFVSTYALQLYFNIRVNLVFMAILSIILNIILDRYKKIWSFKTSMVIYYLVIYICLLVSIFDVVNSLVMYLQMACIIGFGWFYSLYGKLKKTYLNTFYYISSSVISFLVLSYNTNNYFVLIIAFILVCSILKLLMNKKLVEVYIGLISIFILFIAILFCVPPLINIIVLSFSLILSTKYLVNKYAYIQRFILSSLCLYLIVQLVVDSYNYLYIIGFTSLVVSFTLMAFTNKKYFYALYLAINLLIISIMTSLIHSLFIAPLIYLITLYVVMIFNATVVLIYKTRFNVVYIFMNIILGLLITGIYSTYLVDVNFTINIYEYLNSFVIAYAIIAHVINMERLHKPYISFSIYLYIISFVLMYFNTEIRSVIALAATLFIVALIMKIKRSSILILVTSLSCLFITVTYSSVDAIVVLVMLLSVILTIILNIKDNYKYTNVLIYLLYINLTIVFILLLFNNTYVSLGLVTGLLICVMIYYFIKRNQNYATNYMVILSLSLILVSSLSLYNTWIHLLSVLILVPILILAFVKNQTKVTFYIISTIIIGSMIVLQLDFYFLSNIFLVKYFMSFSIGFLIVLIYVISLFIKNQYKVALYLLVFNYALVLYFRLNLETVMYNSIIVIISLILISLLILSIKYLIRNLLVFSSYLVWYSIFIIVANLLLMNICSRYEISIFIPTIISLFTAVKFASDQVRRGLTFALVSVVSYSMVFATFEILVYLSIIIIMTLILTYTKMFSSFKKDLVIYHLILLPIFIIDRGFDTTLGILVFTLTLVYAVINIFIYISKLYANFSEDIKNLFVLVLTYFGLVLVIIQYLDTLTVFFVFLLIFIPVIIFVVIIGKLRLKASIIISYIANLVVVLTLYFISSNQMELASLFFFALLILVFGIIVKNYATILIHSSTLFFIVFHTLFEDVLLLFDLDWYIYMFIGGIVFIVIAIIIEFYSMKKLSASNDFKI